MPESCHMCCAVDVEEKSSIAVFNRLGRRSEKDVNWGWCVCSESCMQDF